VILVNQDISWHRSMKLSYVSLAINAKPIICCNSGSECPRGEESGMVEGQYTEGL